MLTVFDTHHPILKLRFAEEILHNRHLADQLILSAGLANGTTTYLIPRLTEHVETNLWLIETILGAKTSLEGNRVTIEGIGFERK